MSNLELELRECWRTVKDTADYLEEMADCEAEEIRASNLQWVRQKLEKLIKEME
jgi:hypothetical protein